MGRYLLNGGSNVPVDVDVIGYDEPGGSSFTEARARTGKAYYANGRSGTKIKQIILHHDGMNSARQCFGVLEQRGLSTHIIIQKDGKVYQTLDLGFAAFHAGNKRNSGSIGIDLNNPVKPGRLGGRPDRRGGVFRGRINGKVHASMGYTNAQYESLIAVLRGLSAYFSGLNNLTAPVGDDGKVLTTVLDDPGFNGLVGHLHVSATKWDPGPGFDWERVLIGVRGTRLLYPVRLPDARNLNEVPRSKALENAETYFRAIENGPGGFFPVGLNQGWHTGVHFQIDRGTEIFAPADGVVVAARIGKEVEDIGSPNVVVIKHALPIGEKEATFYSVISHLDEVELGSNSPIPWIRRFAKDPDMPRSLPDNTSMLYPPAAPGHIALRNDRVALAATEVKAGELIGYSGRFKVDPEKPPIGSLDFAIIAPKPLFDASDLTFEPIVDDDDDDILCNSRQVWKRFTDDPEALQGLVEGGFPMSPAEIRAPYRNEIKAVELRWMATRHVTEYALATRFGGLFGGGVDFEWYVEDEAKAYIDRIRKFLWWDDAVTEHTGLPQDGRVWAYHPIALATYLMVVEARRAIEQAGAKAVALEGDELDARRRRDQRDEAEFAEQFGASHDHIKYQAVEDIGGRENRFDQEQEDPEREGWLRWEQGEWEPDPD